MFPYIYLIFVDVSDTLFIYVHRHSLIKHPTPQILQILTIITLSMSTMTQNVRHPYVGKCVSLVSASNTSEFVSCHCLVLMMYCNATVCYGSNPSSMACYQRVSDARVAAKAWSQMWYTKARKNSRANQMVWIMNTTLNSYNILSLDECVRIGLFVKFS